MKTLRSSILVLPLLVLLAFFCVAGVSLVYTDWLGQQALLVRLNGLKGSALSLGARGLAAQLRVAEETLDKTEAKDRERFGPPDSLAAEVKHEIEVLQKHLEVPPVT